MSPVPVKLTTLSVPVVSTSTPRLPWNVTPGTVSATVPVNDPTYPAELTVREPAPSVSVAPVTANCRWLTVTTSWTVPSAASERSTLMSPVSVWADGPEPTVSATPVAVTLTVPAAVSTETPTTPVSPKPVPTTASTVPLRLPARPAAENVRLPLTAFRLSGEEAAAKATVPPGHREPVDRRAVLDRARDGDRATDGDPSDGQRRAGRAERERGHGRRGVRR